MKRSTTICTLALATLIAPTLALIGVTPVAEAAPPLCHGRPATLVGTPGPDRLVGTSGRDVIVARGGDDTVIGKRGGDLLCGGTGSDELVGGRGKDRLYGQGDKRWVDRLGSRILTGDLLDGGLGDDLLHPGPRMTGAEIYEQDLLVYVDATHGVRVDLSTGPESERATAAGQGRDRIVWHNRLGVVGSMHDDHLVGSDKRDYLVGIAGDDRVEGADGRDQLYPDRAADGPGDAWPSKDGRDVVSGGGGQDELASTDGRDDIRGGDGDDVVSVTGGRGDRVYGEAGDDLFFVHFSGDGRNLRGAVLDGGEAGEGFADTLYLIGGRPNRDTWVGIDAMWDRLRVAAGRADQNGRISAFEEFGLDGSVTWSFFGTEGPDDVHVDDGELHFQGRGGPDLAQGGPDRDVLYGGEGSDHLLGGRRSDRIMGGQGDDSLAGGVGDDWLVGSGGLDRLRGNQGQDSCDGERVFGCER